MRKTTALGLMYAGDGMDIRGLMKLKRLFLTLPVARTVTVESDQTMGGFTNQNTGREKYSAS